MFIRTVLAISTMFFAGALLAQAYKWTDEDGVVHYSDRPIEGAEELELPTFAAPPPPAERSFQSTGPTLGRTPDADSQAQNFAYETFAIASPAADQTLWNIGGNLNVTLTLQPALQPGHRLYVYLDGNPRIVNSTSFQLAEVWRGSHTLQAEIVDQSGTTMIRTTGTEFFVQQTSINRGM